MSSRKFNFIPGEYYHLYNRGNSKQTIFLEPLDYVRFQRLLFLANATQNFKIDQIRTSKVDFYEFNREGNVVALGAYCLMPNHFHILATPLVDNGVSIFMQRLSTAYSMYFNKKYDRTGSLFEGKFKAEWADTDRYLKYLFAYIHLNPLKLSDPEWKEYGVKDEKKARAYLETFDYSSFKDHLGFSRKENKILSTHHFPKYFNSRSEMQDNLYVWFTDRQGLSERVAE